jgi:hypothetical protein
LTLRKKLQLELQGYTNVTIAAITINMKMALETMRIKSIDRLYRIWARLIVLQVARK